MKPIQPHKDPRITNISFDNFTGSICIITPLSDDDDDEETRDLMLSTSQSNGGADLFKPHHHVALITQPILGARSRRKDKTDSLTNSRRNSSNDSPSLILPINQTERFPYEKKIHSQESSDSGLDFSLSTNSSVQYPPPQQQHTNLHRPLSALNEDSNTDEGFHDQTFRCPIINLGFHRSTQEVIVDQRNEHEKSIKRSNDDSHSDTTIETNQPTNFNRNEFSHLPAPSSIQQHRSLNDLINTTSNNISKQPKSTRRKSLLNIIIEPSISSSRLHNNDEQTPSMYRIPSSSSSSQTTSHLIRTGAQQSKPKAITPLGHYPNPEQIRAHINRSVLERQHPSYLSTGGPRKDLGQKFLPLNSNSSSKTNHLLFKQRKQPMNIFRSNLNVHGGSTSRQTKHILPDLYHEEILDNYHEKRRVNEITRWKENFQKEPIRVKIKDISESSKTNSKREIRPDHQDNFLTSTPRRHYEHDHSKHGRSIGTHLKRQQPINPTPGSNSNDSRNTIVPVQSHPKKLLGIPPHIEQIPVGSINSLSRTTRIQPINNTENVPRRIEPNRLTKLNLSHLNKDQTNSNRFFQRRSPTSWSVISEHQTHQEQSRHYESSSPSSLSHQDLINDESARTYRLNPTDEHELLDGRYVIPADIFQRRTFADCASQTSSRHTQPFICVNDSRSNNDINSLHDLIVPENIENLPDHRSGSSSSLNNLCPSDQFPLPLGKSTMTMEEYDLSTNYDSDDGWSDESAELIYADERYVVQKKKNITSSSSSKPITQKQN